MAEPVPFSDQNINLIDCYTPASTFCGTLDSQ